MNTGEHTEQEIEAWIQRRTEGLIRSPYIWPGSWPDRDLYDSRFAMPDWHLHDSAWIYYQAWDPEIPGAVQRFNQEQHRFRALVVRDQAPYAMILVVERERITAIQMLMWLQLGESP